MEAFWPTLLSLFSSELAGSVVRAVLKIAAGWFLARIVSASLLRALTKGKALTSQQLMLAQRVSYYGILILFLISALREFGFEFGVLLGAAGVLTVALGFASQTSASNLISGLFLIAERAVEVGDVIKIEQTIGEVLSVDLLSTKLRTFDNLLVRIPNETMVKAEITNYSRFPIRRVDIMLGVAYHSNLTEVQGVLFDVADRNPLCLEEPKPLLIFQGFGDSALNLQFSVWTKRENFLDAKNGLQQQIKEAFEAQGIEIPFPHRTFYTGSVTEPFPIRLVSEAIPEVQTVRLP